MFCEYFYVTNTIIIRLENKIYDKMRLNVSKNII